MLKIVYPICCGLVSTVTSFSPVLQRQRTESQPTTQPLQKVCGSCYRGFCRTTAAMSVWKARESTGFQFTTSLNQTAKSFWHTPNMSKRFEARKPTKRMLSGLPTFSSTTLFPAASFLLPTSVSFVTLYATTSNSQATHRRFSPMDWRGYDR